MMNRLAVSQFRRAGVADPPPDWPLARRWYGRLLLLLLGTGLLTAAFAPVYQFYLAWIGLVPWLLVLHGTRSYGGAFLWSWLAGILFFTANMWWMAGVTAWGMVALMILLGLYWGYAGLIIRAARLLGTDDPPPPPALSEEESADDAHLPPAASEWAPRLVPPLIASPLARIALVAAIWVAAAEWFRGTWPWHGLPWLYLGHTQTPALWLCQIVDLTGVAGLSFLLVMANAWIALWVLNRLSISGLRLSGGAILLLTAATLGYGIFRMRSEPLRTGPEIAVIQPNYPQDPSGQKGASADEILSFHFQQSRSVLASHPNLDLLVWSETILPPINAEARQSLKGYDLGQLANLALMGLKQMAASANVGILSGGEYAEGFHIVDSYLYPVSPRNVAYFINRDGIFSPRRYDKIHLVPFGEFTPFKESFPWLYRLIVRFGPPDMQYYFLQPGSEDALTVFPLQQRSGGPPWRLVTPICFEDLDADLCARMFRPQQGAPLLKRADILVNLTNDGWFMAGENAQHLQAAIFRSIENRVPSARSVNTGISGFIDPLGRTHDLLPVRTIGNAVASVRLDPRVTFFTRFGSVFSDICLAATLASILACLLRWMWHRRQPPTTEETA